MEAKIVETFEKIYDKYHNVMSLKELNDFANQLQDCGYNLVIKRYNDYIKPKFEPQGVMDFFKKACANELNVDLKLTPAQTLMYR